ncbi:MAG: hypothetical protein ACRESK_05140 [Gammaproteobacteria bacterium]
MSTRISRRRFLQLAGTVGFTLKEDKQRCMDAGMNGYINKLVYSDELYYTLARYKP